MKKQTEFIVILAFSMALTGCSRKSAPQTTRSGQESVPSSQFAAPPDYQGVVTAVVQPRSLPEYLQIPAQIEPDPTRIVRVYSPVGGRLVVLMIRPGDRVETGETLAILESSDASSALAAYAKAKTDLHLKQEALQRATDLAQHGAFALKDLQQAQADFAMAQAEAENEQRQLRVLGVNPDINSDRIRVVAPRSGVVLQISAAAGEYSKSLDSSDPLCVIADLNTVWAVGDLFEKDLSHVKVGDPAELSLIAFPGETWKGRVSLIASTVDPATRTLKLRVVLPNRRADLRPYMFGSLRLLRATHVGFVVPTTAVVREGNSNYIFVEQAPNRFTRRPVTLGAAVGTNEVEVLSGITSSETVVTQGALLLRSEVP